MESQTKFLVIQLGAQYHSMYSVPIVWPSKSNNSDAQGTQIEAKILMLYNDGQLFHRLLTSQNKSRELLIVRHYCMSRNGNIGYFSGDFSLAA